MCWDGSLPCFCLLLVFEVVRIFWKDLRGGIILCDSQFLNVKQSYLGNYSRGGPTTCVCYHKARQTTCIYSLASVTSSKYMRAGDTFSTVQGKDTHAPCILPHPQTWHHTPQILAKPLQNQFEAVRLTGGHAGADTKKNVFCLA